MGFVEIQKVPKKIAPKNWVYLMKHHTFSVKCVGSNPAGSKSEIIVSLFSSNFRSIYIHIVFIMHFYLIKAKY